MLTKWSLGCTFFIYLSFSKQIYTYFFGQVLVFCWKLFFNAVFFAIFLWHNWTRYNGQWMEKILWYEFTGIIWEKYTWLSSNCITYTFDRVFFPKLCYYFCILADLYTLDCQNGIRADIFSVQNSANFWYIV